MCAVTREVRPEAELIRYVAAPDGSIAPDLRARLPGRGVWVSAERTLVDKAVRKNVFARSLKTAVTPGANLGEMVGRLLKEAVLGRLGLARKAGAVVAGFAKVEAAIASGDLVALFIAADAADDGRRKIEAALHRRAQGETRIPVFRLLDSVEMGLALGRANVIHAAVLQSPAGNSLMEAVRRLQRYGGVSDAPLTELAADPQDVTDE